MANHPHNQVRIIGGQWRGRRLRFSDEIDLRPTPDRVRETLFNWLASELPGARCLDLFAGSGVLGFEALSRGAAYVAFVDVNASVIERLQAHAWQLGVKPSQMACYRLDVLGKAAFNHLPFDIVFVDPPYKHSAIALCLDWLVERKLLADRALVYVEKSITESEPFTYPKDWHELKNKRAGQVHYALVSVHNDAK